MLDTQKTALVVIDLQKGIVAMKTEPHASSAVVSRATRLVEAFRSKNMPVVLVRVATRRDGSDRLKPILDADSGFGSMKLPSDWSDIVPELGQKESDIVITKRQWGAFYGTELDLLLRRLGIDTIVLCGIATNIGVESTARFAFEYGYQQIFVEDATSARSKVEHDHTFEINFPRIGRVRSTEEVLAMLEK